MFDASKNFAYGIIAIAPSPPTSGTSLTVNTGDGAKFPATPFNATIWPAGAEASTTNSEIVRVTGIAGDVLTITRAQEGTTLKNIMAGNRIGATFTAKALKDLQNTVSGKVLIVNQTTGSDASGLPFATIGGAQAVAVAGDLITVMPGTYNEQNVAKADVYLHFMPGASVIWQDAGAGPGYGIIDDRAAGVAGKIRVSGWGEFTYRGSLVDNVNSLGCFVITNAATDVEISYSKIYVGGGKTAAGSATQIAGLYVKNCALSKFRGGDIKNTPDGATYWPNPLQDPEDPDDDWTINFAIGVYWEKGEMHVYYDTISVNYYTVWCKEPAGSPDTNIYLRGNLLESTGFNCFYLSSVASLNYRMWVFALQMKCPSVTLSLIGPGKVYVSAQKIAGASVINCDSGTELWVIAEKLSIVAAGGNWLAVSDGGGAIKGGRVRLDVQTYEDASGTSVNGITVAGAIGSYVEINGGRMKNGAAATVPILHQSGVLRIKGLLIDALSNNSALNPPIKVQGAGLTLIGCQLHASANAVSIDAATPQTVHFVGESIANKAANGNITQSPAGRLVIDATAIP